MAEAPYPWQLELWQQLARREKPAHAFLLHGAAGIGKRHLAEKLLAHWLLQGLPEAAAHKGKSLLQAGTHPDVFVLEPEEEGKQISINRVRELVHFASQTAQLGTRKLILLEPVEAMNAHSANALLKTLEEPPGECILLLISHQISQVLPTVKSRCVQLACPPPDSQSALDWLRQQLPDLAESDCRHLLALAGGSPLSAELFHQQKISDKRAGVVEGCKRLFKREKTPSQLAESWNDLPLLLLLDWFCEWTQQCFRRQLAAEEGSAPADMQSVLDWLAGRATAQKLLSFYDWILDKRRAVLGKANLNRQLLLESLLIQWAALAES